MRAKKYVWYVILFAAVLGGVRILNGKEINSEKIKGFPVYYSFQDSLKVVDLLNNAPKNLASTNEYVAYFAQKLLDIPYVGKTLEKDPEGLVVNLSGLDCTTFMENCLAFARTASKQGLWSEYLEELRAIRYRDGNIDGYVSRLHYFVDWKMNNEKMNLVEDMTHKLGGENCSIHVDFMSTHSDAYPMLKGKEDLIQEIVKVEKSVNERNDYFVLNADQIDAASSQIRSGDLIAFVTTIKGLDTSHVAVAYQDGEHLTFFHASSKAKKTIVEPISLSDYVRKQDHVGIMLLRPLNNTSSK